MAGSVETWRGRLDGAGAWFSDSLSVWRWGVYRRRPVFWPTVLFVCGLGLAASFTRPGLAWWVPLLGLAMMWWGYRWFRGL
jgi:hypothetical protein